LTAAASLDLNDVDINAFISERRPLLQTNGSCSISCRRRRFMPQRRGKPAAEGTLDADVRFGARNVRQDQVAALSKQVYLDDLNFNLYDGRLGEYFPNLAGQSPPR
jgi:hypothetical protein